MRNLITILGAMLAACGPTSPYAGKTCSITTLPSHYAHDPVDGDTVMVSDSAGLQTFVTFTDADDVTWTLTLSHIQCKEDTDE